MPYQEDDERRESPRFPIQGTLVVENLQQEHPIQLLDVSCGGLRFEADREFAPETLIRVILDHYPVDVPLRALVAWAKPGTGGAIEHGAEFVNLPRAEKILVDGFIEENRPEGGAPPQHGPEGGAPPQHGPEGDSTSEPRTAESEPPGPLPG